MPCEVWKKEAGTFRGQNSFGCGTTLLTLPYSIYMHSTSNIHIHLPCPLQVVDATSILLTSHFLASNMPLSVNCSALFAETLWFLDSQWHPTCPWKEVPGGTGAAFSLQNHGSCVSTKAKSTMLRRWLQWLAWLGSLTTWQMLLQLALHLTCLHQTTTA